MVRRRGDDDGMEEDEIDNEKDEEDEGVKCDKNESLVEVRLEGEEEDEDKEGEVEIKLEQNGVVQQTKRMRESE